MAEVCLANLGDQELARLLERVLEADGARIPSGVISPIEVL